MASFDDHRSKALPTESNALSLSRLNNKALNTTEDEQQPPIFRIAAELRNRIYELALPFSTTILLRVENVTAASKPTIRFHPALPPLHYVCRRTHNECPLYQYYTNNIFLFTGAILSLRNLDALVATRGEVIKTITSAKVTLVTGAIADIYASVRKITIRFSLSKSPSTGTIEVKNLTTTSNVSSPENLCFCGTLHRPQHDLQQDGSVLETLRAFVAQFEPVVDEFKSLYEKECDKCGKKTIHCYGGSRSATKAVRDAPREQHDRDPIVPQNWYDDDSDG
ncbi:hypothetical protein LTR17_021827 [Elasticomyces elasticus]|nr:hypothetical protein LTR17_021827 [Elasticomyces elasticus]